MHFRNSAELILYKAYTDLKAEAARSYLGLVWWIVEPIMYLFAFYVLIVLVMKRGGPDFVPTFLCGAVVWKWFASAINGGSRVIGIHQGLLQQVAVPKYIFPVIAVLGSTARFVPVFAVFSVFLWCYGVPVQQTWLMAPAVMCVQFCLLTSLAMLVGAITPFLPDLTVVIDNGLMLLFFISGVFFDINQVSQPLQGYLLINPMAVLIEEYRKVMIRGLWPAPGRLALIMLASVALGTLGAILLGKLDKRYAKVRF